jgi:hypothetical protein
VSLESLQQAVTTAVDEADLGQAQLLLASIRPAPRAALTRTSMRVSPRPTGGIGLSALAEFRQRTGSSAPDSERHLERADLHALLVRGEATLTIRGRNASLGDVHLFLFAERLLALADDALEAWQLGRALFRRIELSGTRISLQRGPGDVPMSLSVSRADAPNERLTFPRSSPAHSFVSPCACAISLTLTGAIRARPNLRLRSFMLQRSPSA